MTAKQLDLNGDIIVSKIVKRTHTCGAYYLRVSERDTADYYQRCTLRDGTIVFTPIIIGGGFDEPTK